MRTYSTFEETYPSQPFAELVRLGIWLGQAIRRQRDSHLAAPMATARA